MELKMFPKNDSIEFSNEKSSYLMKTEENVVIKEKLVSLEAQLISSLNENSGLKLDIENNNRLSTLKQQEVESLKRQIENLSNELSNAQNEMKGHISAGLTSKREESSVQTLPDRLTILQLMEEKTKLEDEIREIRKYNEISFLEQNFSKNVSMVLYLNTYTPKNTF